MTADEPPDPENGAGPRRRVCLLFGSFRGGGVARTMLRAAQGFLERGNSVDLVVGRGRGELRDAAPAGARIVVLERSASMTARAHIAAADPGGFMALAAPILLAPKSPAKLRYLPAFVRYVRRARPDAVLAATAPFNLVAIWARRLTGLPGRVVISEHNQLSVGTLSGGRRWRYDIPPAVLRHCYLQADCIAAVSDGVAEELAAHAGIPRGRVRTVYNPVVGPELAGMAKERPDHPWFFDDGPPVLLGVGMLKPQKDFETLIAAFAKVRAERPARLMILGDVRKGEKDAAYRLGLETLARELGVADDVAFPGFAVNPFAFLARAALFVLSSRWEGLPTVLIEALACGCPVVSTDCPSGPREILGGGRWGRLTPVGDAAALAGAIVATLDSPPERGELSSRAETFSVERAIEQYAALMSA